MFTFQGSLSEEKIFKRSLTDPKTNLLFMSKHVSKDNYNYPTI